MGIIANRELSVVSPNLRSADVRRLIGDRLRHHRRDFTTISPLPFLSVFADGREIITESRRVYLAPGEFPRR